MGLLVGGCGSTEPSAESIAAPATTTLPSPPVPGTITLEVAGLEGATHLVMLSVIGETAPDRPIGALCELVDADPFSFSGQYVPITGDDPCTLGTDPIEFAPGSYEVIVAVLPGGARTPDQCTRTQIAVDGDVTLRVTELGSPTDCGF